MAEEDASDEIALFRIGTPAVGGTVTVAGAVTIGGTVNVVPVFCYALTGVIGGKFGIRVFSVSHDPPIIGNVEPGPHWFSPPALPNYPAHYANAGDYRKRSECRSEIHNLSYSQIQLLLRR